MLITARPLAMVVEVEVMGGFPNPIHVLCPALIIESHDHVEVVRALVNAQIDKLVALLSECIAGASQNNRRNTRYPEIPGTVEVCSCLLFLQ